MNRPALRRAPFLSLSFLVGSRRSVWVSGGWSAPRRRLRPRVPVGRRRRGTPYAPGRGPFSIRTTTGRAATYRGGPLRPTQAGASGPRLFSVSNFPASACDLTGTTGTGQRRKSRNPASMRVCGWFRAAVSDGDSDGDSRGQRGQEREKRTLLFFFFFVVLIHRQSGHLLQCAWHGCARVRVDTAYPLWVLPGNVRMRVIRPSSSRQWVAGRKVRFPVLQLPRFSLGERRPRLADCRPAPLLGAVLLWSCVDLAGNGAREVARQPATRARRRSRRLCRRPH